jgi:hypothetical protein
MNYSRALKGSLTRSGAAKEIFSQAELELGRPLTKEEEKHLFSNLAPQNILERIQKVYILSVLAFHLWFNFSMDMDLLSSCCFSAVDLSSNVMFRQILHQGMEIVFYMVNTS